MINDNDPNYSKARLINKSGEILDSEDLGLSKSQQWELIRLMLKRKEELDDTSIEEYFSEGFLQSNFWFLFRTMFAFKNCHSLLETKLYLHRFLDSIDGFADMSVLLFPKYNQYDTFIKPLTNFLREKGVNFTFEARVDDLDISFTGDNKTVTGIQAVIKGKEQYIEVGKNDLVFALTGSMTENTGYAGMDDAPELSCEKHDPGSESGWNLWKNLAKNLLFLVSQKSFMVT